MIARTSRSCGTVRCSRRIHWRGAPELPECGARTWSELRGGAPAEASGFVGARRSTSPSSRKPAEEDDAHDGGAGRLGVRARSAARPASVVQQRPRRHRPLVRRATAARRGARMRTRRAPRAGARYGGARRRRRRRWGCDGSGGALLAAGPTPASPAPRRAFAPPRAAGACCTQRPGGGRVGAAARDQPAVVESTAAPSPSPRARRAAANGASGSARRRLRGVGRRDGAASAGARSLVTGSCVVPSPSTALGGCPGSSSSRREHFEQRLDDEGRGGRRPPIRRRCACAPPSRASRSRCPPVSRANCPFSLRRALATLDAARRRRRRRQLARGRLAISASRAGRSLSSLLKADWPRRRRRGTRGRRRGAPPPPVRRSSTRRRADGGTRTVHARRLIALSTLVNLGVLEPAWAAPTASMWAAAVSRRSLRSYASEHSSRRRLVHAGRASTARASRLPKPGARRIPAAQSPSARCDEDGAPPKYWRSGRQRLAPAGLRRDAPTTSRRRWRRGHSTRAPSNSITSDTRPRLPAQRRRGFGPIPRPHVTAGATAASQFGGRRGRRRVSRPASSASTSLDASPASDDGGVDGGGAATIDSHIYNAGCVNSAAPGARPEARSTRRSRYVACPFQIRQGRAPERLRRRFLLRLLVPSRSHEDPLSFDTRRCAACSLWRRRASRPSPAHRGGGCGHWTARRWQRAGRRRCGGARRKATAGAYAGYSLRCDPSRCRETSHVSRRHDEERADARRPDRSRRPRRHDADARPTRTAASRAGITLECARRLALHDGRHARRRRRALRPRGRGGGRARRLAPRRASSCSPSSEGAARIAVALARVSAVAAEPKVGRAAPVATTTPPRPSARPRAASLARRAPALDSRRFSPSGRCARRAARRTARRRLASTARPAPSRLVHRRSRSAGARRRARLARAEWGTYERWEDAVPKSLWPTDGPRPSTRVRAPSTSST